MAIPQSIQKSISQGLEDLNVQIKLAYIGEDAEFQTTGSHDPGDLYNNYRRMNIRVLDQDNEIPMNNVLVYNYNGQALLAYQKPNKSTLAVVAMIGKNRHSEACIIITFVDPNFAEKAKETNIKGATRPTIAPRTVSNA